MTTRRNTDAQQLAASSFYLKAFPALIVAVMALLWGLYGVGAFGLGLVLLGLMALTCIAGEEYSRLRR